MTIEVRTLLSYSRRGKTIGEIA